jgi:hypothetical protein
VAAVALFAVGIVGLFATVPGQDAGSAFIPFLRTDGTPVPTTAPQLVRDLEYPPTTPTPVATDEPVRTAVAAVTVLASASPTPSPTPEMHSAVIAAVAADDTPSPTPAPLRAIMIGTDSVDAAPEATPSADATPAASETPAEATPVASPAAD